MKIRLYHNITVQPFYLIDIKKNYYLGFATPDFGYIEKVLGMDQAEFLRRFDKRLGELDLNLLAWDVEPFLFTSEQKERVTTFRDYWLKNNVFRPHDRVFE